MTVALEQGVHNNTGARPALSFFNSVKRSGNLNETRIPVESMGIFNIPGLLSLLPIGVRMFLKGKIPPIIHHSIEEVDDVKRIFKELDK